jgi:hypothetical protein
MTPLPLPTDNLYKFCALSGLAMIAVSLYASWSITENLFKLQAQQALASAKADVESEFLEHEWAALKRAYSDLLSNQDKTEASPPTADKLRVPLTPTEYSKQFDAALETAKRALLNETDIHSRQTAIKWLADERMLVRWISAAFVLIGIWLSSYGFRNWRILQLHHDKLFLSQSRLDS